MRLPTFLTALLLACACAAETLTLWPSDLCEATAQPSSELAPAPDRALAVRTGTRYDWPGVRVAFKAGEHDLAAYGPLRVTVRNTSGRPLTVSLSVKNRSQKDGSPGGSVTLEPGASGTIRTSLRLTPWVLDRPLELVGMRGAPAALEGGPFNVRKTAEFHVFLGKPDAPASFELLSIETDPAPLLRLPADTFLPFVDRFGQFAHDTWPGKVQAETDLARDRAAEEAWLTANAEPADRNRWGGWAAGPQRAASGHFRTEKLDGKWWLVDPDGRLFFSHGVTCIRPGAETGVQHRENYFAWLPEKESPLGAFYSGTSWAPHGFYKDKGWFRTYDFARANLLRKYGPTWETDFAELAHRRLRAWGLNTVANWSDAKVYLLRRTPYTVCLHTSGPRIEGSDGWWGKFPDPYSDAFAEGILKRARDQQTAGTARDPWCIGYFVDNELSWGKDDRDLARATLLSPASQPAKLALQRWLRTRYTTPEALNAAWGTAYASWDAFLASTDKPDEKRCGADLESFHTQLAEQYFRVIRDALRDAAPDKLYLGSRIAWGAPSVYRASAKYCDVVSVNIYSRTVTKDLPADAEDKPMINGEFHFGALDRGLFHTGLVATRDQQERAACYQAFVRACLRHPRYVGTHWFQWRDQALTGRGDGENYQIGFLTVTDKPYPELVSAARDVAATLYPTRYRPE